MIGIKNTSNAIGNIMRKWYDQYAMAAQLLNALMRVMHYPVIFAGPDNPPPLAVLGGTDYINLFVEDDGQWAASAYVPAQTQATARRAPSKRIAGR